MIALAPWILDLIGSIILLLLSAYFSLTETALSCYNRFKFEVKANNGSKNAKLVLWIDRHFDSTLMAILIGNNAASVVLSFFTTYLFVDTLFADILPYSWSSLIGSLVLTIVLYLFGETIPKQIGRKIPNTVIAWAVYPLTIFFVLFFPLSFIMRLVSKVVRKIFHAKPEPELTEEDFTAVLDKNEGHGLLEQNESELIQNSFDFSDTKVKEILTPVDKMFMINLKGLSTEKLVEIVCETNYSRIPVYYDNPNHVFGILIVKRFLADYLDDKEKKTKLEDSIEKPYLVSMNVTLDRLVDGFQSRKAELALVYKGETLLGMVTMEDVLEELVGSLDESVEVSSCPKKEKSA
ncbi:MAG: hemolysin family protein [Erysipelotrichaceae bacterium]|nr:hemolysin family protein [Erysipelotrichaceae bacterium]